jgi:hypothetical protein
MSRVRSDTGKPYLEGGTRCLNAAQAIMARLDDPEIQRIYHEINMRQDPDEDEFEEDEPEEPITWQPQ